MNEQLETVHLWMNANKLSLNVSKTKYMIFRKPSSRDYNLSVSINSKPLERVRVFNFLGLHVTTDLSWDFHTNVMGTKLSQSIGILHKIKKFLPSFILKTVYDRLVLSRLSFHILSWGHEWKNFEIPQKNAIRAVTKKFYNHHTKPLFYALKTLTLEDIYQLNLIKFYHSFVNFELPSYFLRLGIVTNHDVSSSVMVTRHGKTNLYPSLLTKTFEYRIINLINSNEPTLPSDFCTRSKSSVVADMKKKYLLAYRNWSCVELGCRPCHLCHLANCCNIA